MIPPGVASLMTVAMLAELRRELGPRSDDFLIAVGEQIGAACVMVETTDTTELTDWMNGVWDELGLGSTNLIAGQRRLDIIHRLPLVGPDDLLWGDALPVIIEGVYRAWFNRLDPRGVLSRAGTSESELKFVYSD